MDKRLIDSRVYGYGRVRISGPILERYNKCLSAMGSEPTKHDEITVDGGGYSSEVAEEKGDPFYLSNGGAVQHGIIVSTDQMETNEFGEVVSKPILHPRYSFERHVYDVIYSNYREHVANLIGRSGICIEINPGFDSFIDPRDLDLVKSVTVQLADSAGIMEAAEKQTALVEKFLKVPDAWRDDSLREKLIESGKQYGDMQLRKLIIPPMKIPNLEYVNAEVFGGTFCLRNPGMEESLIVVAGEVPPAERGASKVYTFADSELLTRLFEDGFVELSSEWYRENPDVLEDLKESIRADVLQSLGEKVVNFRDLTPIQKKRLTLEADVPKEFLELERYQKAIEIGKEPQKISKKLKMMLMRPKQGLPVWAVRVIWRLISRMTQFTGLPTIALSDLYLYDKPSFFEQYVKWPESRQIWAIEYLEERGLTPKGA